MADDRKAVLATDIAYQHGYFDGHGDGGRRAAKACEKLVEPTHKPRLNKSTGTHGKIAEAVSAAVYNERKRLAAMIREMEEYHA